jgi:plasmid maintenance system antidote protein VapI
MPTTENVKFIEANEVLADLYPVHPGTVLKMDVLPSRKVSGSALAEAIGATQPSVAARIEAATGYPASLLLKMQTSYDLAEVRRGNQERLHAIPRMAAFA